MLFRSVSQSRYTVGVDITLTGGESGVFDGVRGFFVINTDDSQYVADFPIEFKKSPDGVVGARISSIDASIFNGIEGTALVVVTAPNIAEPISFKDISFNVSYSYYSLQSDVQYSTYPFATESHPNNTRLLAYRFRAYESVYNAYYRDIRNNPFVVNGRPVLS